MRKGLESGNQNEGEMLLNIAIISQNSELSGPFETCRLNYSHLVTVRV